MARKGGGFSDFDGKPGSADSSPSYDRRYDRDGSTETSNELEDRHKFEEQMAIERDREETSRLREALEEANSRIHYWPNVGKFVIPKENTFSAHLELVQNSDRSDIGFNPDSYAYFDKLIADTAERPDIFDPTHRDYAKHQTVRDNLAVLRNDIMGIYMDDGSFDPGDEKFIPSLVEIAEEIGNAIRSDRGFKRGLFVSVGTNILDIEGEGSAYLYKHLVERQVGGSIVDKVGIAVRSFFGQPLRTWNLPPMEETPFSNKGLSSPPPPDALCNCPHPEKLAPSLAPHVVADHPVKQPVETVKATQKREVVHHGKIILDWLRNLKLESKAIEERLDSGRPEDTAEAKTRLEKLTDSARDWLKQLTTANPELAQKESVRKAERATEQLTHSVKLLAALEMPTNHAASQTISAADRQENQDQLHDVKNHIKESLEQLSSGVEETMAQQQQDQDKQEEIADQALESALGQYNKRRKKRRRQGASKTTGIKKASKDLQADDRVLGQGAYANRRSVNDVPERNITQVRSMALEDLEVVKALGKTLAESNGTARELAALQGINVTANDKIAPDEQSIATRSEARRIREQQQNKQI